MNTEVTFPVSIPACILEQVAQLTETPGKQTDINNVVDDSSAAADDILAGLDECFDDIEEQDSVKTACADEGNKSGCHDLPVDVWMADGDAELRFAVKMLAPSLPDGMLPQWDARTGVCFLFRPAKRSNCVEIPYFLDVENGVELPASRASDLEDAVHSRHVGMRVIIFYSQKLKERSVVVCQIRSDLIQIDQTEPMYDRIAKFFNVAHGRHVLFLSPQPSQFGTLKTGAWWDKLGYSGRFHQVLCNLDTLNAGTHDVTSPIDGAVKNFQHASESFYPDSWLHVCCGTRSARFETKTRLRDSLLCQVDEGPVGCLRAHKLPSPLIDEGGTLGFQRKCGEVPGNIKLAFMRVYLAVVESAFSRLCDNGCDSALFCGMISSPSPSGEISGKEQGEWRIDADKLLRVFQETGESVVMLDGKDTGRYQPLYMCLSFIIAANAVGGIMSDIIKQLAVVCKKSKILAKNRETEFYRNMAESKAIQDILRLWHEKWVSQIERSRDILRKIAKFDKVRAEMHNASFPDDVLDDELGVGSLLRELSLAKTNLLLMADVEFSREVAQKLRMLRKRMIPGRRCNAARALAQYICDRREKNARTQDSLPAEFLMMKKRGIPNEVCNCFNEMYGKYQDLSIELARVVVQ